MTRSHTTKSLNQIEREQGNYRQAGNGSKRVLGKLKFLLLSYRLLQQEGNLTDENQQTDAEEISKKKSEKRELESNETYDAAPLMCLFYRGTSTE